MWGGRREREGREDGGRKKGKKCSLMELIKQFGQLSPLFFIFFKGPVDEIQWHLMAGLRTAGAKAFSVRLDNEDQSFCF